MKRFTAIVASTLTAALFCFAAARAATNYNDTLSAILTASAEGQAGVTLIFEAAGDLPGMGKVTLQREGNNVVGGYWTLTVLPANADASSSEKGRLNGAVTGGTFTFNSDGSLTGVSSVQLAIGEGTGQYASVSSGSGTLNLSTDAEKPSKLKGTLALDF